MATKHQITVNDRVAYSANFLRSTGQTVGAAGFRRGTVTAINNYGSDFTLATIRWDYESELKNANVKCLARVGSSEMSAN